MVEYCPATLWAFHHFTKPNSAVYSFVLSAASSRNVSSVLLAQTNAGWFRVTVPQLPMKATAQTYKTPFIEWTRNEFYSPVMYIQFPDTVTVVQRLGVREAQTSGEQVLNWDAQGSVTCKFQSLDRSTDVRDSSSTPSDELSPVRVSELPYNILAPPAAAATFLAPLATQVAFTTDCAQPFAGAVATRKVTPTYPVGLSANHPIRVMVEVALSTDGKLDDAWIWQPSGSAGFDFQTLEAARTSRYEAARAFCQSVPGYYLYVVTFSAGP